MTSRRGERKAEKTGKMKKQEGKRKTRVNRNSGWEETERKKKGKTKYWDQP